MKPADGPIPSNSVPLFLLAGGPGSRKEAPDPLLLQVFAAAGRPRPAVAYVGAASKDNPAFFSWLAAYLRRSGAGDVVLVRLAGRRPDLSRARAALEASDLVFLSGGDVEQGMAVLERTGMILILEELFRRGKPFFGLSAGSIMLAECWIRWEDPEDEESAASFPCLGFAPILCDTHGEDEGWEELAALLRLKPEGAIGYGIPTGAGLRVGAGDAASALGGPIHRLARRKGGVERIADLIPG